MVSSNYITLQLNRKRNLTFSIPQIPKMWGRAPKADFLTLTENIDQFERYINESHRESFYDNAIMTMRPCAENG